MKQVLRDSTVDSGRMIRPVILFILFLYSFYQQFYFIFYVYSDDINRSESLSLAPKKPIKVSSHLPRNEHQLTNAGSSVQKEIQYATDMNVSSVILQKNFNASGIPHRLVFVAKGDLKSLPSHIRDNVQNTIRVYRNVWNEPDAPVLFMNDTACRELIAVMAPTLVVPFDHSPGPFKSDICRVVALKKYGGYYFDNDMGVIQPITFNNSVDFSSAKMESKGFFQSFLASTANHPILLAAITAMEEFYLNNQVPSYFQLMGPMTVQEAWDNVAQADKEHAHILFETDIGAKGSFPDLSRPKRAYGQCTYVVHDAEKKNAYFWSRIPGVRFCKRMGQDTLGGSSVVRVRDVLFVKSTAYLVSKRIHFAYDTTIGELEQLYKNDTDLSSDIQNIIKVVKNRKAKFGTLLTKGWMDPDDV